MAVLIRILFLGMLVVLSQHANAEQLYSTRWVKVAPAGQPWSGPTTPNQRAPSCTHTAGCSCFNVNKCGTYGSGATTIYWPNGCSSQNWAIQCQVELQAAAPSGPPAPIYIPTPPPPSPAPIANPVSPNAGPLYSTRWVKIAPAGQPWSSPISQYQGQPTCTHAANCSCPGVNKCGVFGSGATTTYWPFGCSSQSWTIQCQVQVAQPSGPPAPVYVPTPPAPVPSPYPGPIQNPSIHLPPDNLCPKNVGASQPAPIHPGDSPILQCIVKAHNDEIACDQNVCPRFLCGDDAAARRYGECIRVNCDAAYEAANKSCQAIYGRR